MIRRKAVVAPPNSLRSPSREEEPPTVRSGIRGRRPTATDDPSREDPHWVVRSGVRTRRPGATNVAIPSFASQVTQRHAALSRMDHFQVLEVPYSADRAAIRRAAREMSRRFHPDRLRGDEVRLRPLAQAIHFRIAEALRVLDGEASRENYSSSLTRYRSPDAKGTPGEGTDPQKAFLGSRALLKQGRFEDARLLARRALDGAPDHPAYAALHAWLRVQCGELQPGSSSKEILGTLNRAVRERSDDAEIRMYRARVLQRLGRQDDAARDFAIVTKIDPGNVEAAREVRLHGMRSLPPRRSSLGALIKLVSK